MDALDRIVGNFLMLIIFGPLVLGVIIAAITAGIKRLIYTEEERRDKLAKRNETFHLIAGIALAIGFLWAFGITLEGIAGALVIAGVNIWTSVKIKKAKQSKGQHGKIIAAEFKEEEKRG
jgi:cellobiose-specific phosphotransferase system component IIC